MLRLSSPRKAVMAVAAVAVGAIVSPAMGQTAKRDSAGSALPRQVELINKHIRQGWEDSKLKPSPKASDGEWCRRVHLDLIGRIPSVGELNAFLKDASPHRRQNLVARLMGEDYVEEYARNMTTIWTNLLIGRNGGTERRSLTNREGMQQYLRRSFLRNKTYDKMVYELVAAEGTTKPGHEQFNGAVNFLVMKLEENAALATAKTSQLFLGVQVQCTQCHNHPFNEHKQNQFWELNAFFRQTRALRRFAQGRDIDFVELTNEDFAGEGTEATPEEAEIYYEPRNGELIVAYPTFIDGTPLKNRSGFVEDVNRRKELAKLVVNSDYMTKAIVNRMWGRFLGYGFTKPLDDMGPHNGPTHPELLNRLADEFRKHSCNLKELMTWIALSEPYALSSQMTAGNASDDPQLGERPSFSHFYLRQMRAEELYESLLVATRADKTRGSYDAQEKSKAEWLKQFIIAFGTDEGDETTTFNGSIPQSLMLMNGDLIKRATSVEKGSFLHRIATDSSMSARQKITHLYMAALARAPRNSDLTIANKLLRARANDVPAALQDVWWAVLNSNEFILNH